MEELTKHQNGENVYITVNSESIIIESETNDSEIQTTISKDSVYIDTVVRPTDV
jgi:hypothetical protein